jgi:hypothetical protein
VYVIGTFVGAQINVPTTYPVGQQLIIKNGTAIATAITINVGASVILLTSDISGSGTTSLQYGDILSIIWNGAVWFQQTSTSKFSSIVSRGAISGTSLSLASGNISSVGTIATSSSITSGAGGITATTGSISTAGGSISQTGTITGESFIGPSLNAAFSDTNVAIASTQTGGSLSIGTGARTTAGTISIGTGSGSVAVPISIGGTGSLTTINGKLTTAVGTIAGKTSYLELDTGTAFTGLDCSTANLNVFILFYSAAAPLNSYVLSNVQDNQTITFKNWCDQNTPITITLPSANFYPYGFDNGTAGASSISLSRGNVIEIQRISGKIYQVAPSFNGTAVGDAINIATTQTSGILNIGTGSRTTAGTINIGTGSGAINNVITIGGANSRSTIGGYLYSSVSGYIAGAMGSASFNSNLLPFTLSPPVMRDLLLRFTGSTSGTMTIAAGYPEAQRITLKNTGSGTITITFTGNIVLTGATASVASAVIGAGGFVSAMYLNPVWIQT